MSAHNLLSEGEERLYSDQCQRSLQDVHHPPWAAMSIGAGHSASLQFHCISNSHGKKESYQDLLEDKTPGDHMETELCGLRLVAK